MRGRKPKPTTLKLLKGTLRKGRLNRNEPRPGRLTVIPDPPDHLSEPARTFWADVAPELTRLGLLTALDLTCFAALAESRAQMLEAGAILAREGLVIDDGQRKHPAFSIWRGATELFCKFATEFGMTPSSRSRVNAVPETIQPDGWDKI